MTQEILVAILILGAFAYIARRIFGRKRPAKKTDNKPDIPLTRLKQSARDLKKDRKRNFDGNGK